MPWVRIDDQFTDHPKVLQVGPVAECLFVRGLTYASRYLTDGFVPTAHLRRMGDLDASAEARKLVAAGLWTEAEGGFQIHDYLDYQPSAEKVKAERDASARRQAAWRDRRRDEAPSPPRESRRSNGVSNGVTNGRVTGAPSRTRTLSRPDPKETGEADASRTAPGAPSPAGPAPAMADNAEAPASPPSAAAPPAPPSARNGGDGATYALVDAFARATSRRPGQIQGRDRSEASSAFRPLAADVLATDVAACVAYLRSDPFWQEPGKLTARKVAATLPEWIAAGRPQAMAPRGAARANGKPAGVDWEARLATERDRARQRGGVTIHDPPSDPDSVVDVPFVTRGIG